jgi:hypothetical protein
MQDQEHNWLTPDKIVMALVAEKSNAALVLPVSLPIPDFEVTEGTMFVIPHSVNAVKILSFVFAALIGSPHPIPLLFLSGNQSWDTAKVHLLELLVNDSLELRTVIVSFSVNFGIT